MYLTIVLLSVAIIVGGYAWYQWRIAKRTVDFIVRMHTALLEPEEFYSLLKRCTGPAHFMQRHSPVLQRLEIQGRAFSGSIPFSGLTGKPVSSSRWLKHSDLLHAIESALSHWSNGVRPKGGAFKFEFDHLVGEGYQKGTTVLVQTRYAKVVIKKGVVITTYPMLDQEHVTASAKLLRQ